MMLVDEPVFIIADDIPVAKRTSPRSPKFLAFVIFLNRSGHPAYDM